MSLHKKINSVIFVICIMFVSEYCRAQNLNQDLLIAKQLENSGRIEEAQHYYEKLYKEKPDNIVIFSRFRDFCIRIQAYNRALELIKVRKEKGDHNPDHDLFAAQIFYRQGKQIEALNLWNKILKDYPKRRSIYYKVASSMAKERLLEEALDVYKMGRKKFKDNDLFALNVVSIYEALLNYNKAAEELLEYLKKHPDQGKLVESKIFRFSRGRRAVREVTECLRSAVKKEPRNFQLRKLLMDFYIETEQFENGWNTALKLFKLYPDNKKNILLQFGKKVFTAGSPFMAEKAFRAVLESNRDIPAVKQEVYYNLARCLEVQKKFEDAVVFYRKVSQDSRNFLISIEAEFKEADILKNNFYKFQESADLYESLIKKSLNRKQKVAAHLNLGECRTAAGRLDEAEIIYKNIFADTEKRKDKFWIRSLVKLSELYYLMCKFDKSLEYLDRLTVKNIDPGFMDEESLNDGLKMKMFIKNNLRYNKKGLKIYAEAELFVRERKFDKALVCLDSLLSLYPDEAITAYGLFQKGIIQIETEDYKAALNSMKRIYTDFPLSRLADRALERSGWIYQNRGKPKRAQEQYETLLREFPGSLLKEEVRLRIRNIEKENR